MREEEKEPVMARKQFTFYRSFAIAAEKLPEKEARADFYDALVHYGLWGEEPDWGAIDGRIPAMFELLRPNLDAARRKAEAGRLGGLASSKQGSKKENKIETKKETEIEYEIEIQRQIDSHRELLKRSEDRWNQGGN